MPEVLRLIGRAKTVLVDDDRVRAVVTAVVAHATESNGPTHIRFVGPAAYGESAARHITDVVVPIVERIVQGLHLSGKNFEISLVNPGATAAADIGVRVSGFSGDVAVFLALLSAALAIPVPQDVVATGHVASADGDIALVRAIPAKLAAAAADPTIRRFVYPAATADGSLMALSPAALRELKDAILGVRERLKLCPVRDVPQLLEAVFEDEDILLASLKCGFFHFSDAPMNRSDAVGRAVAHLAGGSDARFWSVLERFLLAGKCEAARELLLAWASFHIARASYPTAFGRQLLQLVRSLPPGIRQLKTMFPLLPMADCISLSQFATDADHEDVLLLHAGAFGKRSALAPRNVEQEESVEGKGITNGSTTLDAVLAEIDPANLATTIGLPIDAARASYGLDVATVDSWEEFNELVAGFYLHLLRHTRSVPPSTDPEAVAGEALDVLEQTFLAYGGYKAALAEGRHGTRGGMRFVLDMMTERVKREEQVKQVNLVFKSALDALDWEARVAFMAALMERLAPHLPLEIRSESPEQFARHLETIVRAYVQSFESVKALLRTL